jgi:hypothetical protein
MKEKEALQEVIVSRSIADIEVITDAKNDVHVTVTRDAMAREIVRQLTGLYIVHGIHFVRRSELMQICSKAHGLMAQDTGWGINHVEKPIDDLVDEGVIERVQYTQPKKATFLRLTNKYVNNNLK